MYIVDKSKFLPDIDGYKFGIPELHTRINVMKNLFNISCNIEFKKPQARSEDEKSKKR